MYSASDYLEYPSLVVIFFHRIFARQHKRWTMVSHNEMVNKHAPHMIRDKILRREIFSVAGQEPYSIK